VEQLDALKSRHTDKPIAENDADRAMSGQHRVLLPPYVWRLLAILLALFCGVFLTLSYRESLDLSERETVLRNKDAEIRDYEDRVTSLSGDIGGLSAQRNQLRKEINALTQDAGESAENAATSRLLSTLLPKLREEHETLKQAVTDLGSRETTLGSKVEKHQARLDSITTSHQSYAKQLDKLEEEIPLRRGELGRLETTLSSKSAHLEGITKKIENKQGELQEMVATLDAREEKLAQLKKDLSDHGASIAASKITMDAFADEDARLAKKIEAEKAELSALAKQMTLDRKQSTDLTKRKNQLSGEVAQLDASRQQFTALKKDLADAAEQISTAETTLAAKTVELSTRNQEIARAGERVKQLERAARGLEDRRLELERNVSDLRGQQKALSVP